MWKYTVEDDAGGEPRWRLYDGAALMAYSEGFASTSGARQAASTFKAKAGQWRYTAFPGGNGRFYWHAQGGNNEIVASGGNLATQAAAEGQMNAVRANAGAATGP